MENTKPSQEKLELEARRILEDVAKSGTYTAGHIRWTVNLANSERIRLQEELKDLLNINPCIHDQ